MDGLAGAGFTAGAGLLNPTQSTSWRANIWLYATAFNAAALVLAFMLAVVTYYLWQDGMEAPPAVAHADIPGVVQEYKWEDVAKDRPSGCPWSLAGCNTLQDVIKHVWRLDDELLDDTLATGELKEAFDEVLRRCEAVSFLEVQPPVPGDIAASTRSYASFEPNWLCLYKFLDGTTMFGGSPHGRHESDEACVGVRLQEGLVKRRGGGVLSRVKAWALDTPHEEPELLRVCSDQIRRVYEVHDGFGTLLNLKHAPMAVASPMRTTNGSGYYVYPLRSCRKVLGYNGLVQLGRIDSRCCCCVVRSTNSVAYVEISGAAPEIAEESPMEYISDTLQCLAGSLQNGLY